MSRGIVCKRIPAEFSADRDAAKQYFSEFGRIQSINFQPAGICVVEYETAEEAKRALHGSGFYKGKTFIVQKQKLTNSIDSRSIQEELDSMSGFGGRQQQQSQVPQQRLPLKVPRPQLPLLVTKTHADKSMAPPPPPPLSPVMIHKMSAPQLQKLISSPALTSEQKYRALDARDKLYRIKRGQTTDITRAKSTKGACPDMCPEKERLMREAKHQIASFEMSTTSRHIIEHRLAVKQYSRSSADQEMPLPSELRSEPVLRMTMMYLLHEIADLCDTADVGVSDWFHFLWDRTRSIRKDITQQELCCQGSVRLVEQCARFHIHCAARLVAEEPQVFDQKINTENLTKCLQSLKYMYHDLRLRGEQCPNEAEFRAYIILLNLHDSNFLWEVKQLPGAIQQSAEVRFAIDVFKAMEQNNYVRFFKLVRRTTYLNSCILLRYFNQVRARALATIVKAYSIKSAVPLSLSNLAYTLAFEDEQSGAQFFEYYGLSCDEERVQVDRSSFYYPDLPYLMDRAINVVEQKRFVSAGAVIAGGEDHLAPKSIYQNHVPENSFDSRGYLRMASRGDVSSSAESDGESEANNAGRVEDDQDQGGVYDDEEDEGMEEEEGEDEEYSDQGDNDDDDMSDGQESDEEEEEEMAQEITDHVFKKPSPVSSPFRPMKSPFASAASMAAVFKTPDRLPNLPVSGFSFADLMTSPSHSNKTPSPKSPGVNLNSNSVNPFIKSTGGFSFTDSPAQTPPAPSIMYQQQPKTPQTPDDVKEARLIASQLKVESLKRNAAAETNSLIGEVSKDMIRRAAEEVHGDHVRLLVDCRTCEDAITTDVVRDLIMELHREECLDYHVGVYARQKLLKRAFAGWRKRSAANRFTRDLALMTPLWLPPMASGEQAAAQLESEHQRSALGDLARYRRGLPNAMKMTSPTQEKINVEKQIARLLTGKYPKHGELFFKMVISIPGPGEEAFGASEFLQRWFKENLDVSADHRLPMVFTEVRLNDFHSVGVCIRLLVGRELRQEDGSVMNSYDENLDGIVFCMSESRSAAPRKRFQRLIERRGGRMGIPVVVLNLDDYVAEERIMTALGMDDERVGAVLVDAKTEKRRMKETFQESINFLVEQHSLPNATLRSIPLVNLVASALGETFWMRLHINSTVNAATNETLKHGQMVVEIYNEAVEKLIEMCCQDYSKCVDLPREFRKMVSLANATSNYYHHFPSDWRSKERREVLKRFLENMKLKQFPPVRISNSSFETMAALQDFLNTLFSAAPYLVPNMILHMVQSLDGRSGSDWVKPLQLLTQELFLYRLRQAKDLPEFVIYDESLFAQYNETPWWLHSAILKRRVEVEHTPEPEVNVKKRKLIRDLEPVSAKGLDDLLERANKCCERANRITGNFKRNQDALAMISSKYDERLLELTKL